MRKFIVNLTAFSLFCVSAYPVMGGGLNMKAGKWEFTHTVTMSMMPTPQVSMQTECVTEEETSDPLKHLVDESSCQVVSKKMSGENFDFEIKCTYEGGMLMGGIGHFTGKGKTASGSMDLNVSGGQLPITMRTTWEGKYLGPCNK